MVPVVGPLKDVAHHVVGSKGTAAVSRLVAVSVGTVEKADRVGAEDGPEAALKWIVALEVIGAKGVEPVAPRILAAVVAACGALPLGFGRQPLASPLAEGRCVVPRHQRNGVVLPRGRILQGPLREQRTCVALVLSPLRHRYLVFVNEVRVEVNLAHGLLVKGFAFHTSGERPGRH